MTWYQPPQAGGRGDQPLPMHDLPATGPPYAWGSLPRDRGRATSVSPKPAVAAFVAVSVSAIVAGLVVGLFVVPRAHPRALDYSSQTTVSRESLQRAVVRVSGEACNHEKHGTGFFVDTGLIVTNAHVVAGVDYPSVGYAAWGSWLTVNATVVYFDPDDDLAVLETSLSGEPLPLAIRDPKRGSTLVAPGFPQGGDFQVKTAVFEGSVEAGSESIYGDPLSPRRFLTLKSSLEPGNSGSPVIDPSGEVVGVASAVSRERRELGVAVPHERLASALAVARTSSDAVGTGSCWTKED